MGPHDPVADTRGRGPRQFEVEKAKKKKKRESETNESPTDPSTEEKERASRAESATKGKQGNLAVLSLHPCPSTRRAAYEREPHLEVFICCTHDLAPAEVTSETAR
uniref:Uncharacterized protein n=1 Tax=Oryza glumipatula TaxID=40148 RepID=A0A0D9ZC05_9ORYZ